ncbi:hypothetical protein Phum_PHUM512580 [Pediculus humanus corporis]|uniref:Uncharacterized protein n=1 Tax=Pediculus humanus subsp. corporis TaxID=121224 RepID=E0VYB9_PEDHC|nr:uncharacterized protein Phum_PHUM512580 [Pediculus humanus corporis]EEB18375.1 hypothetical protein Phum_PHUM512580 [Pediculus humanus corporis]
MPQTVCGENGKNLRGNKRWEEEEEEEVGFGMIPASDAASEYILKDDLVDNLNIKDEIAKDLGLKDEITSALDQHEDDAKSGLENNSNGSNGDFLNGETGDFDVGVGGGGGVGVGEGEVGISEETDLIRKFSDEDASGSQVPTVSLEEALQLVGLDDLEKFKQQLKGLGDDPGGSSEIDEEEEEDLLFNEMIQTAQFHTPQSPHSRSGFPENDDGKV